MRNSLKQLVYLTMSVIEMNEGIINNQYSQIMDKCRLVLKSTDITNPERLEIESLLRLLSEYRHVMLRLKTHRQNVEMLVDSDEVHPTDVYCVDYEEVTNVR